MSFLANTKTDLVNILAADGEAIVFTDRDAVGSTNITTVIHRTGDEGEGFVNIPTASIASPLFEDKIVDANNDVWYISEVMQKLQGRTPCKLRAAAYWETLDLQEMGNSTEVWTDNTTGIKALITVTNSNEIISAEDGHLMTLYDVQTRYLTAPRQRMRFKWVNGAVTRYIYVQGRRDDDSHSKYTIFECVEEEA